MSAHEYKCPCCGGGIVFDATVQKLKCPYCDTEFDIEKLEEYEKENEITGEDALEWESGEEEGWQLDDTSGLYSYQCNSCGAQIIGDQNLGATRCPYCDNPIVLTSQFSGKLKPDVIIPFKLDKKAAKAKFEAHLKGKRFLPKVFTDQNHIDEIKGMYVPFWLFDSDVDARMSYKTTRVRTWSDANYTYTQTNYYTVIRGGHMRFEHVPVDGSSKMADELMESIEPFDYSQAVPFNKDYLAGYLADKYDVTAEMSTPRANQRIKRTVESEFNQTVHGYATVTSDGGSVRTRDGKARYAMYPVWILNTTWNGEKYMFAMNGQTGKFVGDLPLDKGALRRFIGLMTGGLTVAFTIIARIIWGF